MGVVSSRVRALTRAFVVVAVASLSSACATIPAGYRGIKVYLLGSPQGVESEPLGVGRYAYWPISQEIYKFPTFQQNTVFPETVSFQTTEGLSVGAQLGISYMVKPESVPVLFQKFRRGIDEITNIFLRNMVIDAMNSVASEMTIESVYGKGRRELLDRVTEKVAAQILPYGIVIDRVYATGEFRFPGQVVDAINAKIEATQRAQQRENEIKESEAEAQKRIAQEKGVAEQARIRADMEAKNELVRAEAAAQSQLIRAEAEAKAILLRAKSLTPEFLSYESINKWNGALPQVSGAGQPLISLPPPPPPAPRK
ncbi:MAG: SPFH domain-containing protein [Myxococcaceae bacterium]|jgi:regulator of protease activity HflC (stomatin/prohibitin superfamily)|nr:SPFH domain-containing protein [Myxococcaceae bacterium]